MKTALSIIGIVFLVLLVVFGAFIGFVAYEGSKYDSSSQAYVDESVPTIVTNWSKEELIKRESPQFRKVTNDDDLTKLFHTFNELGPLKNYGGSKGSANMNVTQADGLQITARYTAQAEFQNGKAEILISLIQIDGTWEILGFRVNSPLFLK